MIAIGGEWVGEGACVRAGEGRRVINFAEEHRDARHSTVDIDGRDLADVAELEDDQRDEVDNVDSVMLQMLSIKTAASSFTPTSKIQRQFAKRHCQSYFPYY
jgi:hypothetical protein